MLGNAPVKCLELLASSLLLLGAVAASDFNVARSQDQFEVAFGDSPFVVVLNYRSNVIIDWTTPGTTLTTAASSEALAEVLDYSEGIGHAAVFFRNRTGGEVLGFGQTGEDHSQGLDLLERGMGFTAITNMVFTDGSMQNFSFLDTKAGLAMEAHDAHGRNATKFAWIGFNLTQQQADDAQAYINRYISAKAYTKYGFAVDPLKLQGGGCTSFANAIISNSGLPFPLSKNWDRQVYIPAELMGFNQTVINETTDVYYLGPSLPSKFVPIYEPLVDNQWADANDTSATHFTFYDPELFYLASSFSRNALLTAQGAPVIPIVDRVKNDSFAESLEEEATKWINSVAKQARLEHLFGMQGVVVPASNTLEIKKIAS